MRKGIYLVLFFMLFQFAGFAQKQIINSEQVWVGYVNQTRLSDKWGFWFDANFRTNDNFTNNLSVSIIRPGVTYFLSDNSFVTAGYAYGHYFGGNDGHNIALPEHRPWQQIMWINKYPKLRLQHRLRLEERFRRKLANPDKLADGYNFNYRVRYNFSLSTPLNKKAFAPHTLSFVFNDEAMLNFGKEIVYNTFDQNRLFAGLNYHVNQNGTFQFGYMNTLQQQSSGKQFKNIHTLRFNYLHNLDLRRKESKSYLPLR